MPTGKKFTGDMLTATHMTMPSAPRDPLPPIHGIRGCQSTCPSWKAIILQLRSSSPRCCVSDPHPSPSLTTLPLTPEIKGARVSLSVTVFHLGSCHSPIPRDFPTSDQNPHCVTKASHSSCQNCRISMLTLPDTLGSTAHAPLLPHK